MDSNIVALSFLNVAMGRIPVRGQDALKRIGLPTAYGQYLPGNVRGVVGGQESDGGGLLVGISTPAHGNFGEAGGGAVLRLVGLLLLW
jgi:hypothetical protein